MVTLVVVVLDPRSTMDKVTYASDTTAAVPGANLSSARYGLAATGNSTAWLLLVVVILV